MRNNDSERNNESARNNESMRNNDSIRNDIERNNDSIRNDSKRNNDILRNSGLNVGSYTSRQPPAVFGAAGPWDRKHRFKALSCLSKKSRCRRKLIA